MFVTRFAPPCSASRLAPSTRKSRAGTSGSRICFRQTTIFIAANVFLRLFGLAGVPQEAARGDVGDFLDDLVVVQRAVRPIPARQPEQGAEQAERGDGG